MMASPSLSVVLLSLPDEEDGHGVDSALTLLVRLGAVLVSPLPSPRCAASSFLAWCSACGSCKASATSRATRAFRAM